MNSQVIMLKLVAHLLYVQLQNTKTLKKSI